MFLLKRILPALIAFAASLCLPATGSCQLMTNVNVDITLTGGIQLTVKGDIANEAGTTIANAGVIDLSGNWINNSGNNCFGLSAGTVVLNGGNQGIGGSSMTVFYNLSVEGTGTKTLFQNETVGGAMSTPAGTLSLLTADLDLNSRTLYIANPDPSGIVSTSGAILSEDEDNSSKVDWHMQSVQGSHVIPFANIAGADVPVTYNLVSGNHGHVVISTYGTDASNAPYPVLPNAVTSIFTLGNGNPASMAHRYWQVDPENTGQASEITFSFDPVTEKPLLPGPLYMQLWDNSTSWYPHSAFQSMPSGNSVKIASNSVYGTWGMALESSPLPISLLSFNARLNGSGEVDLTWATSSEVDNDYFTVERSANGIDFEEVLVHDGAGNSSVTLYYADVDRHPLNGLSYYRLKQTDFDGKFSYSAMVAVKKDGQPGIKVYPNPAREVLNFEFREIPGNNEDFTLQIKLYDVAGRLLLSNDGNPGMQKMDISSLAAGAYKVVVTDGSDFFYSTLITKI